jgi:cell division protein FtsL
MPQPQEVIFVPGAPARIRPRTARQATERRISRKAQARYAGLLRFTVLLFAVFSAGMLYVMLTAHLTGLNYATASAQRERGDLTAQTARLDDRVAALRDDERLAAIAAKLHMGDPQQFALVTLPQPRREDSSHLAFLSGLAGFFGVK